MAARFTAAAKLYNRHRSVLLMLRSGLCPPAGFRFSSSVGRTADPHVHAGDVDGDDAAQAKKAETAKGEPEIHPVGTGESPFSSSSSPLRSSPKIGSRGAGYPVDPNLQQKRRDSDSATPAPPPLSEVSCAGLDGGPWPEETTDRRAQEEDDREYFKHHKASPLSEVKVADTRKPVARATDSSGGGGRSGEVLTWRPEQLDTAEGSLLRAMEIWKYNAGRGDPDSPHGKVLRELRGEYW
ncbi:unnamed protein product [Cuscuta campestris]|uniref:Uncharacterized protein n=1 Tax=Cuscuta campestris TaxID=132261 RepID=A0A484K1S4_9ASTE|nr:unnamed protein product [Cuscuta campestris]